jgi:phage protein D/phage baseplate assembly protein gpV
MSVVERFASQPTIEINGSAITPENQAIVELVIVQQDLSLPDMFEIRLRDADRDAFDKLGVKVGATVKISAGPIGESATQTLIAGEVTALEGVYDSIGVYEETGSRAVIRGYDRSHRLHRGRHTETYRNVTDSDIARTVAQRAGLDIGSVDSTSVTHEHVSQINTTDWEFLRARARECGREVDVVDGKFEFRVPAESGEAPQEGDLGSTDPLQFVLDDDVDSFRPRVTSAEQVSQVEVRGWDPAQKQAIVATAEAKTTHAALDATPSDLASTFGSPIQVMTSRPLQTQAEADEVAKALAEQIACAFAEADGVVRGNPRIRAGTAVSISQAASPFTGKYIVTSTRHVFDHIRGYKTHFVVSGRQERSLLGLASLGATNGAASAGGPPISGVVTAIVTDVKDPEKRLRVKLKFPWLSDTYESDWVRTVQFGAGKDRGAIVLPEVNDEVLVAFEHGDVRRPFVVGNLYNGVDTPYAGSVTLVDSGSGAVNKREYVSRTGHLLAFIDGGGRDEVILRTSGKDYVLQLDRKGTRIYVKSDGKVAIEATSDVTVTSKSKISMQAPSIELKADTNVKLEAGANADIKANAQMNVQGAQTSVKGSAMVDIDGGATLNAHAGLVRIN